MFILVLAYQRDTSIVTRSSTILIKMGILDKTWMDKRWRKVSLLVTSIITLHCTYMYSVCEYKTCNIVINVYMCSLLVTSIITVHTCIVYVNIKHVI